MHFLAKLPFFFLKLIPFIVFSVKELENIYFFSCYAIINSRKYIHINVQKKYEQLSKRR